MTAQDLYDGLLETGYPVAYREFKSAQEPPFICYYFVDDDDLKADNKNYHPIGNYNIEFYTDKIKDTTGEAAIEAELETLELVWTKSETYIESEDMYEVLYQVQLI